MSLRRRKKDKKNIALHFLTQLAITYSKLTKKSTRERNKICSKLTIKTPIVFIVNFEQGNAG